MVMFSTRRLRLQTIVLLGFLFGSSALFADVSATIVDYDGELLISRNGVFLDEYEIDYGTELFTHDILQTGVDGYAEIIVNTPVSPELSIKVMPDTTLYIEHALKSSGEETSLNLHRGAVQARAATLINGGSFSIRTDSSVMGVRGTVFTVNTSPDSSILVTCREGKVICTTKNEDAFIAPGKIYETNANKQYAVSLLDVEGIDAFTEEWKKLKMEALMINGAISIGYYANLYLKTAPSFLESYSELEDKQALFKKWETIMAEGKTLSMSEATRDKIALSNGIIRLRSRLPMMEHVYYTLYDLTNLMDQNEGSWDDVSDSAIQTLNIYNSRKRDFREKMTLARYYFKIFLEIDRQSSGQGYMSDNDLMEDFFMDDSFFVTPPAPGQPSFDF